MTIIRKKDLVMSAAYYNAENTFIRDLQNYVRNNCPAGGQASLEKQYMALHALQGLGCSNAEAGMAVSLILGRAFRQYRGFGNFENVF